MLECALALPEPKCSPAFRMALARAVEYRNRFGLDALKTEAGSLSMAKMIALAPAALFALVEELDSGVSEGVDEWAQDIVERHLNTAFGSGVKH